MEATMSVSEARGQIGWGRFQLVSRMGNVKVRAILTNYEIGTIISDDQ